MTCCLECSELCYKMFRLESCGFSVHSKLSRFAKHGSEVGIVVVSTFGWNIGACFHSFCNFFVDSFNQPAAISNWKVVEGRNVHPVVIPQKEHWFEKDINNVTWR